MRVLYVCSRLEKWWEPALFVAYVGSDRGLLCL